jgi:hypothetical protein
MVLLSEDVTHLKAYISFIGGYFAEVIITLTCDLNGFVEKVCGLIKGCYQTNPVGVIKK